MTVEQAVAPDGACAPQVNGKAFDRPRNEEGERRTYSGCMSHRGRGGRRGRNGQPVVGRRAERFLAGCFRSALLTTDGIELSAEQIVEIEQADRPIELSAGSSGTKTQGREGGGCRTSRCS